MGDADQSRDVFGVLIDTDTQALQIESLHPSMTGTLLVSEVFGPTIQGEGPSLGRRCAFLRLGRCNLTCGGPLPGSTWRCDTPYTWDWHGRNGAPYDVTKELKRRSLEELAHDLSARDVDMVVISGGEPLLQQRSLWRLLFLCRDHQWNIELETNGTIAPMPRIIEEVDQFNVSPKLANSGVPVSRRYVPDALSALQATGKAIWKFVCSSADDLEEVAELYVRPHGLQPIYVMPAGTHVTEIQRHLSVLADEVIRRGWNLTTRLHVQLWGSRRGV